MKRTIAIVILLTALASASTPGLTYSPCQNEQYWRSHPIQCRIQPPEPPSGILVILGSWIHQLFGWWRP